MKNEKQRVQQYEVQQGIAIGIGSSNQVASIAAGTSVVIKWTLQNQSWQVQSC